MAQDETLAPRTPEKIGQRAKGNKGSPSTKKEEKMTYVYFEFADGSYCCSDHLDDPDAVALFARDIPLVLYEVRARDDD
jgi:hypothetical protein